MTLWSLALQAAAGWSAVVARGPHLDAATLNGAVALVLIALAAILIVEGLRTVRSPSPSALREPAV
jgi:hypothetical protein